MVRPTVALFARPDGLSVRLVEALLSNLCFVEILSDKKALWEEALSHIPQKNLFKIINPEKQKEEAIFEYLILLNENLFSPENETIETCRFAAAQRAKILILLPFSTEGLENWQLREDIRATLLKKVPEAGIIYVGDIYGPRYLGEDKNFLTRLLTRLSLNGKAEDCGEAPVYPLFTEALIKYLTRTTFSFGPYGKEVVIYSEEISAHNLLNLFSQLAGQELSIKKESLKRKEVLGAKKETLGGDLFRNLRETTEWFKANLSFEENNPRKKGPKNKPYFLKRGALAGVLILALLPFLLMATGAAGLLLSTRTEKALSLSVFANRNAQNFFQVYSQIPLLKIIYRPFLSVSNVLAITSDIGAEAVKTLGKGRVLANSVFGGSVYDPTPISQEIATGLGEIYNKTGLLQGEVRVLKGTFAKLVSKVVSEEEIETLRGKILYGKSLIEKLPQVLGKGQPKVYLILFQNNMELRPTGGFIGSFALVSFDGGRLTDVNVLDVYSADGQLKGHVEPPTPIKKYLGEANWFLRDSNWDPDFPTSAQRAEWFLEKEIDKKVDGVIALDLEVAKGVLKATGPIILADFNQALDYKNLYENLQNEVESEFFPGSQKKTNLMTGLTREIINRLSNLEEDGYTPVAEELFSALEERHVQIFFNDQDTQESISKLGYSGEFFAPSCVGNCFSDWYGAVDANVGVTKANYFVNRAYDLKVTFSAGISKKTLTITYENTANPALGVSGRYKTYTRLFVPANSTFEKVKIDNAGSIVEATLEEELETNQKEGGVAIEISPGQTKKLIFSWENKIPEGLAERTEYRFYIRKQAGTIADPISIDILTEEAPYSYNTNLARDFFTRVFIK
ncbi:DUF4012 domain-containing protein [Candidatus Woesebacteria bacterium]|nr:DUF4012 domain-containing protein [Candidatus Woesebacteria bacterium]